MLKILKIKLELLKYFSKERIYVCGSKVFDEIICNTGTIMPPDVKTANLRIKLPEHFDAIAFGKVWICSDLLKEDFVMPLSKTIQLLEKELDNLKGCKVIRKKAKVNSR